MGFSADIKSIKQKNCNFGRKSNSPVADLTKVRLADAKAQQEDNSRKELNNDIISFRLRAAFRFQRKLGSSSF